MTDTERRHSHRDAPPLREVLGRQPSRPRLGERKPRVAPRRAAAAARTAEPEDSRERAAEWLARVRAIREEREALGGEHGGPDGQSPPTASAERAGSFGGEVMLSRETEQGPDTEGVRRTEQPRLLSLLTGSYPGWPLIVLFGMALIHGLEVQAFIVLLPEIRNYLGESTLPAVQFWNYGLLLALVLLVPVGYLADRLPRKGFAVAVAGGRGLMSFATAFAPTAGILGTARMAHGMQTAVEPSNLSLLADYYPRERRAVVYAVYMGAYGIAAVAGGFIAGQLARLIFWQVPFLLYGIISIGIVYLLVTRLKEPARGVHERLELGATEDMAVREDPPPSIGESWRLLRSVRTMRRWLLAALFFGGTVALFPGTATVFALLKNLMYFEQWELGLSQRSWIATGEGWFELAGIVVAGLVGYRLMRYRPGRVLSYMALAAAAAAGFAVLFAYAPALPVALASGALVSLAAGVLKVWPLVLVAMVAPPRVRGFALGFSIFLVFASVQIGSTIVPSGDPSALQTAFLVVAGAQLVAAFVLAFVTTAAERDTRQAANSAMAAVTSREARKAGDAKLLTCRGVDVHYDDVQVLFGVDFEVEEGEIIALLGTNGAGKSTLLRAVSGLTPPTDGTIVFDYEDVTYLPAHERVARGITFMPGGRSLFPTLSVAENLKLAAWMYRRDEAYVDVATGVVLQFFPILRERYEEPAGNLSGGEQQMLALGQAFLARPRLLMIDELSLGLAPTVVEQLLRIVRAIHRLGTTIIIVEQSVNVALTVAERAVFMEKGEVRFSGSTAELLERSDILRSVFLKGASAAGAPIGAGGGGRLARNVQEREVVLEAQNIQKRFGGVKALNGISLTLEEGNIIGLIGPNGAGKTTLFDAITGFLPPDEGKVLLYGDDITELGPDDRAKLGMQRSFQDARLFPALTVYENLAVALERHLESRSAVMAALHLPNVRKSEARLERRIDRLIDLLNLGEFRDKFVRELSTGSRRLVDLACILAADPKVVLLDEPSSGIAQAEAEELGPLLQRVKFETGCSMLIIEHDMPLIKAVSNELIALDLGTVVTRGLPDEVTEHPRVVESYLGADERAVTRSGEIRT